MFGSTADGFPFILRRFKGGGVLVTVVVMVMVIAKDGSFPE